MKRFNPYKAAAAMVAAAGLCGLQVQAAERLEPSSIPAVAQLKQTVRPVRPFRGQRPWGSATAELQARLGAQARTRSAAEAPTPSVQFEELSNYDFLEGPDGTTWFYTCDYDIEQEIISEWYTEERIVGYTFTVYDATFSKVGTIKDRVTLQPGETKVAGAVLDPAVSTTFFNDDARPEAMVYLAMNTSAEYGNEVRYYNKVYTIGGEQDDEGNDRSIATLVGRCVDVFNAAVATGGEQWFYTFVQDVYPDLDDYAPDQYLDYLNAIKTQVTVMTRAEGTAEPTVAFVKDVYQTRYPGDTTDGIYLITKSEQGTAYFVFSQYEKPYFLDPTGFATDENATEDNSLLIEVYRYAAGAMSAVSTTKIPVEILHVVGEVNYTFYSIGSVAWKDDVDMSVNGTPEAPAFVVTRDVTKASNLEEVASSYDIYSNDGALVHRLVENSDGMAMMATVEGTQPQALFVHADETGQYTFRFVDLYSGEAVLTLAQEHGGDPLTAVCQRVATAEGEYAYVFEMQYDELDAEGNDVKRLAWIGRDGETVRIDKVNMGPGIMASSVNMYAGCLSPTLYDTDEAMEYAVLVKRMQGDGTTRNEFLVVDDSGDWYVRFSADDGKGSPQMFTIVPAADRNRLQMVYVTDDRTFNIDVYDLPFASDDDNPSGIETVEAVTNLAEAVYYDLNGRRVFAPKAGLYVRKSADGVQKVAVE